MNTVRALNTAANWSDADGFYEALLDAHQGLTKDQSDLLNARLILLLANQLGDGALLAQCIAAARQDVAGP